MKRIGKCRLAWTVPLVASMALYVGCFGGHRLEQPDYEAQAGTTAVADYDSNGDGSIDGVELDEAPGLLASLQQVDANGDGKLTAEEIQNRIADWREVDIARTTVPCTVTMDGEPLVGAHILFDPEPFLGPNVKPGVGTTGPTGGAAVSIKQGDLDDPRFPGVACGWYKVRITSDDREIPARYNSDTTLGCEVALNAHWTSVGYLELNLTSKPTQ